MSDSPETVSAILNLTPSVAEENVILATERGRADVVKLFFGPDQEEETAAKLELREKIMNGSAQIDLRLPKSVEFRYENEIEKLRPLLSKTTVAFSDLLEALHVPPVHVDKTCAWDCRQGEECDRMRQVFDLLCLLHLSSNAPYTFHGRGAFSLYIYSNPPYCDEWYSPR